MNNFLNTTTRNINWFKTAHENGELELKPPFQRNPVWSHAQKSYLIDTILNGYPIPEIYMQDLIFEDGDEKHIIIDGQQRIRACLEFLEGDFQIKKEESPSWGNMGFEDLSGEQKKKILGYVFFVRLLPEMSDELIRAIFRRLNKNVVALNDQELRQAMYWGPFITTMQEIANYPYWSTTGIFSPLNIRRMMDVEYISELAIAILHGHQNKKTTIDRYYVTYEEEFETRDDLISIFQKVLYELEQLLPDIKTTRWRQKTDFYSLFIYLASHAKFLPLGNNERSEVRKLLDDFENKINAYLSTDFSDTTPEMIVENYGKSIRASSDLGNRKRRHQSLSELLDSVVLGDPDSGIMTKIKPMQAGIFEELPQDDDQDDTDDDN